VSSRQELTSRDVDLIVMLARGHTTDRIARQIRLSRHTVGERISNLLERFQCQNRTELVAYFYAHGLLEAGTWPPDSVVAEAVGAADPGTGASGPAMHRRNGSLVPDLAGSRNLPESYGRR
jgi:DNA-binding CsgD family transcriptional regulator